MIMKFWFLLKIKYKLVYKYDGKRIKQASKQVKTLSGTEYVFHIVPLTSLCNLMHTLIWNNTVNWNDKEENF